MPPDLAAAAADFGRLEGYALAPLTVFDTIFGRCQADTLIAIGSRRPSHDNPDPFPHYLIALPVRARQEWLPEVFNYAVDETQYFIPNTLRPDAVVGKRETLIGPHARARYFGAKNENVAELCALVVDLDCYKEPLNLHAADALGKAVALVLRRELPMPAMAAYSGKGAYLVWLLRDEQTEAPPLATRDNSEAWSLIASEIVRRTEHLGGDPNAKRLANWYKRPGTIDTKTGREVIYLAFGGPRGFMPLHRLSDLQAQLGVYHHQIDTRPTETPALEQEEAVAVEEPPTREEPRPFAPPPLRRRKKPEEKKRQTRLAKGAEPYRVRVAEIERLNQFRGGFLKNSPSRRVAVWIYHNQLRAQLRAESENNQEALALADKAALDRAIAFARTCKPPLTAAQVVNQVKAPNLAGTKNNRLPKYFRGATLAEKLGVTAEEALALDLKAIAPKEIRDRLGLTVEARKKAADTKRSDRKDRNRKMADLIAKGRSDTSIAAELHLDRVTVWRHRARLKKTEPRLFASTS